MRFDLLTEPWIPAIRKDGSKTALGLADVLLEAHELRWIEAEAPVVTAALHRLVLALAHSVYGPADRAGWKKLWADGSLSETPLKKYLHDYGDRFDLFGSRPFLQCPGLAEKPMGSAKQLLLSQSAGTNATLFHHSTSRDHVELSAAAAARWMVTLQAFDPGGLKTPFRKDRSSERGLCNHFGTVLVEGATVQETLLLNMPVYAPGRDKPSGTRADDCPQWELDEPPGPEPRKERVQRGWTDLLTWPSRRILLRPVERDGSMFVDGAVITPGDRLRGELSDIEQQAAFRQRMVQQKGGRYPSGPLRPVMLEELRGPWVHCRELLLPAPPETPRHRPRVLDHVAQNAPDGAVYTLRIFGQQLVSKAAVARTWLQESIPAPVALLRVDESDDRLERLLGLAVDLADNVGWSLGMVEKKYEEAFSLSKEHADRSSTLTQWFWPELSAPFGVVLRDVGAALATEQPSTAAAQRALFAPFERWRDTVERIAEHALRTWVWNLPRESGRQLLAMAEPEAWFQRYVTKRYADYLTDVQGSWDLGQEGDE